jgi:regulator of RNase E activity RraA
MPRRSANFDCAMALIGYETPLLSDALERIGRMGALLGVRPLSVRPRRIAGRAVTIGLAPADGSTPTSHFGARAVDAAGRGDVLVVANDGRVDVASWGGLLSVAAAARGVEGVVVDGACRDVEELSTLPLEVFCRGVTTVTARGRLVERSFGEAVTIGGVTVAPGDWVVGDASGVVVLPAGEVERIVETAHSLARREAEMRRALASGRPAVEVLDRRYETLLEDEA